MIAPVSFLTPEEQRKLKLHILKQGVEGMKAELIKKGWSKKSALSIAKAMYEGAKK